MSEKMYESADGFKCTLSQMVKIEPEWAANRIRVWEKLQTENKALKELLDTQVEVCAKFSAQLIDCEQSRDRLLEALKGVSRVKYSPDLKRFEVEGIIQKAEAQKEKETK